MASENQIRVLERFNEKVDKLERLRFLEEAARGGAIVEWRKSVGWDGVHVGPREESLDAAVLTLRFFLQNNEPTLLFNIASLYPTLGVSSTTVDEFLQLRQQINDYLDHPSNLAISEECQLTHREILEMFLWGDLSHANKKHETTFRAVSQAAFFPLFQSDFVATLSLVIRGLRLMRDVNKRVISEVAV